MPKPDALTYETVEQAANELRASGVAMVLYPLSAFRAMNRAAETVYAAIRRDGTQARVLPMLREAGIGVSIDDFGTGFSCLSILADITADELKVDRSLIASIEQRPRNQSILRAIVSLASALGMEVVAEGIETEVELSAVRDAGIGLGQGYLLCRPMPLSELTLQVADICAAAERIIRPNAGTGTPPSRPRREGSSGSAGHRAPR